MEVNPTEPERQSGRVPLQIVLCLDGTNNTLTGRQSDTNVLKLFEALAEADSPRQLRYYDPGVGSPDALPITDFSEWVSRKWERVAGLALGGGIYENIGQAYQYLMENWQPGCQIFIVGFSRGAFTARSVAGMINLFGIVKPGHEALLQTLLRVYFAKAGESTAPSSLRQRTRLASSLLGVEVQSGAEHTREQVAAQVRKSFAQPQSLQEDVHFVGVWDTVESVGLPGFAVRITSPSTITGKRFRHIRHALSLDEHRRPFLPRLYIQDNFGDENSQQSLIQLWFAGVHADVGGGYDPKESGLPDVGYQWLAEEAGKCGLRGSLHPVPRSDQMKPGQRPEVLMHDPLHTVPWWAIAGMTVRDTTDAGGVNPVLHPSTASTPALPSVWDRPRSKSALVLSVLGFTLGMVLFGFAVTGWSHDGVLATLQTALFGGSKTDQPGLLGFLTYQFRVAVPAVEWAVGWLCFLFAAKEEPVWVVEYAAHLGWATAAEILILASYCYFFGRLTSWSITNLAGRRTVGQSMPWWRPLGRSLTLMVVGDVVEHLFTLALPDTAAAMSIWRVPMLICVSLGALAKYVGLTGVILLTILGAIHAGGRTKGATGRA